MTIQAHHMLYQGGLSCKRVELFLLFGKKLDYLHLNDFLKRECQLYFEATIDSTTTQNYCCLPHLEP